MTEDAAKQAKEAMERTRAAARARGKRPTSAKRAARDAAAKRRDAGVDSAPYGKGREPESLDATMREVFTKMGWTENLDVAGVTARWNEVVGDLADRCEPISFENGTLTIQASSTAWSTQLRLIAGDLRARLNESVGRNVVNEIKVVGPATRSWSKGSRRVPGRGPRDTYG